MESEVRGIIWIQRRAPPLHRVVRNMGVIFWMLWGVGSASANPYAQGAAPLTVEKQPFEWRAPSLAVGVVELVLHVPEGYAVYRDQIAIRAAEGSVAIGDPVFPEPKLAQDLGNPEEWRALYDRDVVIQVPVKGAGLLELELEHQGCRKGLCWPMTTAKRQVRVTDG